MTVTHFIFFTTHFSFERKRSRAFRYLSPYNLKWTLRQGLFCKQFVIRTRASDEQSVRMTHASIDHRAGGTANSNSIVGNSLLRADWTASSCAAARRAETLRSKSALPPGHHSACSATW